MKLNKYIVDGNVINTKNVVGFAGERIFIELTDLLDFLDNENIYNAVMESLVFSKLACHTADETACSAISTLRQLFKE